VTAHYANLATLLAGGLMLMAGLGKRHLDLRPPTPRGTRSGLAFRLRRRARRALNG
jgi:hypothetical protein